MRSMIREGFTLIEVLIATVILAVVGTGLLQISSNYKKNFEFLKRKSQLAYLASIPLIHNNQKYHNSDKTLYQFVEDSYTDIDDDLRRYLDQYKVHYEEEEISSISTGGDLNDSQDTQDQNNFSILFNKITITHGKDIDFSYKIILPIGDVKSE